MVTSRKSGQILTPIPASGFDRRAIPPVARESCFTASDDHAIRRIDWPVERSQVRGSLLFLAGRGDAYEKYLEVLGGWHAAGWQVTSADWRGQAGSGRLGIDPAIGDIDDFSTWIGDLAGFWSAWRAGTPGPHVVVGHSMGGHLVLRAIAERRLNADAVVLVAPMLGIGPAGFPPKLLHRAARTMCLIGDRRRPAWKSNDVPGVPAQARATLLTHCAERYADEAWWREARPEIALGPPSWRWIERAYASILTLERPGVLEAVRVPLLILAGTEDRLVSFRATKRAAARLPHARLETFGSEARHELLREADPVRTRALHLIEEFLDRAVPGVD